MLLPRLFEASWEVCNPVGGIHTVLSTKSRWALDDFPDRYLVIGPDLPGHAPDSFREQPLPAWLQPAAELAVSRGASLRFGQWTAGHGAPALLMGWQNLLPSLNDAKGRLWKEYQLDTLGSDFYDLDQPLAWGLAVGIFAQAYAECAAEERIILHLHEWLSGSALLQLGQTPANLRTVFTCHATVLGRALSGEGRFIYGRLGEISPDQEARRLGVLSKHQLERLAAQRAHLFTSVSTLTADEAAAFLGIRPALVLENGLDLTAFPDLMAAGARAASSRERLLTFARDYCAPLIDLGDDPLLVCTMGRYEPRTKGYDLLLRSLGDLNQRLMADPAGRRAVAFLFVPAAAGRISEDAALRLSLRASGSPERIRELPAREAVPPSPFELAAGGHEQLLADIRQCGLLNRPEDRVTILWIPVYLHGMDGIFNRDILELIAGCDLGAFPSEYEPWGYTPMEALAAAVPAVTTTLTGFGQAVRRPRPGLFILDRRRASDEQVQKELLEILRLAAAEDRWQWSERRANAYHVVRRFGWDRLFGSYQLAYHQAWQAPVAVAQPAVTSA